VAAGAAGGVAAPPLLQEPSCSGAGGAGAAEVATVRTRPGRLYWVRQRLRRRRGGGGGVGGSVSELIMISSAVPC